MIKGSCLCEGVKYEYDGEITEVAICHCNMCKRAQGTPFVTNAPIEYANFRITQGEDLINPFHSSPHKIRAFCSRCGSPLYSQLITSPEIIRLRLGTVTEGKIPEPHYHSYSTTISKWFKLDFSRPMYDELPHV